MTSGQNLVGTWRLAVSRSAAGYPPFFALHTYSADGTLTETTSVFGKNLASPGHGVWQQIADGNVIVFEVFSFDESGEYSGRVQVRGVCQAAGPDRIVGKLIVDVFPPGGEPRWHVDEVSFEGERIKISAIET